MLIIGLVVRASRLATAASAGIAGKSDGRVAGATREALSMSVTRAVFISIRFPFVIPALIGWGAAAVLEEQRCKPAYKAIFGNRLL